MKKLFSLAVLVCTVSTLATSSNAGLITNYSFTGNAGNEVSVASSSSSPLVSTTSLVRGSGVTASTLMNAFSSSGWTTAGLDADDYYQFSITTNADTLATLNTIFLRERRSGTGIRDFQLRTSTDGFTTFANQGAAINVPDDTNQRDHSISLTGLSGLAGGTTVTFRLYGYNSEAAGGTWGLYNHSTQGGLYLDGTIAAIPEPTAFLLVASTIVGIIRRRRIG